MFCCCCCFNLATSIFSSTRATILHYSLQLSFFIGEGHLWLTRAESVTFLVASLLAWASSYSTDTSTFLFILYTATARFCYYMNSSVLPTKSCPHKIMVESNRSLLPSTSITEVLWFCYTISIHSGTGKPFCLAMVLPGPLEKELLLSL